MLPKPDDIIPPIVINSTFRPGQNNTLVVPLHRNSIQCNTYSGKNAFVKTQYPISTYGAKQQRNEQVARAAMRTSGYEQNTQHDRVYTSISAKNNMTATSRPGYSPKGVAFAPGFYCRKVEKDPQPMGVHQKMNINSYSKASPAVGIKYHTDRDKPVAGAHQFSTGIVGTVLTGNGQSKLTYYQARDMTLDWPLHNNYKQQRRVCSALASKRKVPSVIS